MCLAKTNENELLRSVIMIKTVIKTGFLCMVRDESEEYLIIDRAVTGVKVA